MIKKIGIFFSAIFIALVGIFSVNPLKNTAEPEYFNKTIKNAVVESATNEYTFYLDNEVNNYNLLEPTILLNSQDLQSTATIFKADLSSINIQGTFLVRYSVIDTAENTMNTIIINETNVLIKYDYGFTEGNLSFNNNTWYFLQTINEEIQNPIKILGIKFTNIYLADTIENVSELNAILTPYIGNLTDFPQATPSQETPLDKIGSIINSIIDWFITIFNGLGDIFVVYDNGSITGLSTWGTIVFIPLAIGLVITVLRWVIRLVRGI